MDVYLKNNKDIFHFPVNPIDSITINKGKKYDTVDILDYGEVDLSDKGKKIKELNFNTLLPCKYDTYCRYRNISKPVEITTKLEKWMEQQEPLRLIITDFNFNDLVIISSISEEERAGEPGDKYISISFRAWRDLKIETISSSNKGSNTLKPSRPNNNKNKFNRNDIVRVTADVLNVRSGPGTNNSIIGSVSNGTKLKVWRAQGNWLDVFYGNHGGWICSDYVTK